MSEDIMQKDIFAKTLFYEAGSTCGILEVLYIAFVIRNRVDGSRWYGKNYIEVCLKKWQFSCWNNKTLYEIEKIDLNGNRKFQMCMGVADYVMNMPRKEIPKKIQKSFHYIEPTLMNKMPGWVRKMKRCNPSLDLKHIFLEEK